MNDANQGHRRRLPGAGRRGDETPSDEATTRGGIRLPGHEEPAPEAPDEEVTHTGIRLPRDRRPQDPPTDEEVTHTGIQLPRHDEQDRPPAHADPEATTSFPDAVQPGPPQTSAYPTTGEDGSPATERLPGVEGTMPSPALEPEDEGEKQRGGLASLLREMAIVVSVALVISFLVKTFLAQPFWIPSGSMNDTLIRGDRVIVSKLTPTPVDLSRGDVVVFEDPGGWLPQVPQDRGPLLKGLEFVGLYPAGDNHLIKRVIGMPGDKVVCCDDKKRIMVNGTPLTEPYLHQGDEPSSRKFSITVPDDKLWVMGDHRSDSSDSRFHDDGTGKTGSVPIDRITGRALVTVWPLDRLGWLSDHSSTFDKVNAP